MRKLPESHRGTASASLLAANADQPSPPYCGRQHAVIGAPPSNCADGGPSLVTVRSLDWQKLPGYW